jgi:DNA-directed RNA polymerase beta subunit
MTKKITVVAGKDELGEPEVFTWDLFPIVDPKVTLHLDTNGLPKVGTRIKPGMILVGKIGKSQNFEKSRQPNALEIHGLTFEELRSRFGGMWKDGSLYATSETAGIVERASIESENGQQVAVIYVEVGVPQPGISFSMASDHPTVEA